MSGEKRERSGTIRSETLAEDALIQHSIDGPSYVAISEISVPDGGAEELERAFANRLGAVDSWPGFRGLELLKDRRVTGRYLMVCRWDTREHFLAYMRSEDHRQSHTRIPRGPHGPSPAGFTEYTKVAE